ncbi:DIS3-like exonuclease 2 [Cylas formicarius]|uniref:DIS3-like exonuclease 2 n=1 Tax=Cylas formicarius TaxID=197179 RepID=UPI002958BC94|nr:DIS3-like exonuclease 2 [Cylas formicarius]
MKKSSDQSRNECLISEVLPKCRTTTDHTNFPYRNSLFATSKQSNIIIKNNPGTSNFCRDQKVKKNRRKERVPKGIKMKIECSNENQSTGSKETLSEISKCTFHIHPVRRPKFCMFRKRNTKHKYINLKSFAVSCKTYIFESNILHLGNNLDKLGVENMHKEVSKKIRCVRDVSNVSYNSESIKNKHLNGNELIKTMSSLKNSLSMLKVKDNSSEKKKKLNKGTRRVERKILKKPTTTTKFPEYISEVEAIQGLKLGKFIKGYLRINPKCSRDSYVSNENSSLQDYYITSVADRNRALDGDEVVLALKSETEWLDGKKTAVVVYILQMVHPRTGVGSLSLAEGKNNEFALFQPRDKRLPFMSIPMISWPDGFKTNPKLYENILFVAKLVDWPQPSNAKGIIIESIGMIGELKCETQAILKEFCLDTAQFHPDMVQFIPKSKDIPQSELSCREDLRKECVFTIDPFTAKDLDDALSVKKLDNGHYEVGVHISDASYYLPEGTELDKIVGAKGTTIYLVDNVYHMLPVELCLHCSLLPGEDKLAFSVFWEMSEEGEVFNTRFARTVVNSCTQLAYEHAQCMIEFPDRKCEDDEFPDIYNGFTSKDISAKVNILQKIAVELREARIRNGSLRIDQVKLLFSLNPKTGEPLDFKIYENKESHRMIEEFMLLANISVAKKIHQTFPDIAFLRCHEPPKNTMLLEAQRTLETCGIHINVSSSGSIHASLKKYITNDFTGYCRGIVLHHIFTKPMTRARYFCAGAMESEENFAHYALSLPIYTHFTSPIRRYADIMVHRLLAASLGYAKKPGWKADDVCAIAANCNKQKYNAKRAGEASSDLYLCHFIEQHQPYIQDCVVIDVKDRSFDAIVLNTGSIVRIYQKACQDSPSWKVEAVPVSNDPEQQKLESAKKILKLTLTFPKSAGLAAQTLIVEMFTIVKVELKRHPNSYKLDAHLLRPIASKTFANKN